MPQKSRRVHFLDATIQSVQQIHRVIAPGTASLCLEILDKNPTAAPWNQGQLLHQTCPALVWMLWGNLERWSCRSPSFFVPLHLGWEQGHTGIYLCESAHVGLWEAMCIQASFLIIFSLVTSTIHSCILFPHAQAVWMYLAGRITIVPLGFFPPLVCGMNILCRPQIIPVLGLAACPLLGCSHVARAEIWWCPSPISGVCQTSPFCRQGREAAPGRKAEKALCWLETVSDPFLVFYVLSAVCVVQCMSAPVDRFSVCECCRLLLDC